MAARRYSLHAPAHRPPRLCGRMHDRPRKRRVGDRCVTLQHRARPPAVSASSRPQRTSGCRMVRIRATSAAIEKGIRMIEAEWWEYDSIEELADAVAGDVAFIVESAIDARGSSLIAVPCGATGPAKIREHR